VKILNYIHIINAIIVVAFVSACKLETAKEAKKQELIVASDFLNYKDVKLFQSFEKNFNIEVTILTMDTDSLLKKLNNEKYATRIDIIMLKSALDMCQLEDANKLQKILNPENRPDLPFRYRDNDHHWYGLSIDPYIIVSKKDSLGRILNYGDLAKKPEWTTNLKRNEDLIPLFTTTLHQWRDQKKDAIIEWHDKLLQKETQFRKPKDSVFIFPPLLTTYSSYYSDSTLYRSAYKRAKLIYPNQNKGGLIYKLRAIAIVKQARNYTNAVDFINYLCRDDINQRINNWWNTFPINSSLERSYTYQNKRFKSYPVAIHELCSFRARAENLLTRKRKK
jgi:iron(III) transport system substrate-binding protein